MSKDPQFSARQSQQVAADKKRSRQLDWEDTRRPAWVAWLSVLCLIALLVSILALSSSDRVSKPQNINGDQLGPFDVATSQEYFADSEQKLEQAQGDQPRWALVTPRAPMAPSKLARSVSDPDLRVSTLLVGPVQWVIPEPASGLRRADVLRGAAEQMAEGAGVKPSDIKVEGVLVRGTPEQLRAVAEDSAIAAVEPADAGAVYGRIGIRPVSEPTAGENS